MQKLGISRFTSRILIGWCVLLFAILLVLNLAHVSAANPIAFHALTLNGFLASLLMGLRIIVLFLVFSTLPKRWPVTLLAFLSLTMAIVAITQLVSVVLAGNLGVSLLYLVFVASFCGLLYTAIMTTSQTIMHNAWDEDHKYFISWFQSLMDNIRRYSLPLLGFLLVFSFALSMTYAVTF